MKLTRRIVITLIGVVSIIGVVPTKAEDDLVETTIQKIVGIYCDNFLNKEAILRAFNKTADKIKETYSEQLRRREHGGSLGDEEKEELFCRIASSEVSKFRNFIETEQNEAIFQVSGNRRDQLDKFLDVELPREVMNVMDRWDPKKFVDTDAEKKTMQQLELADREAQMAQLECQADKSVCKSTGVCAGSLDDREPCSKADSVRSIKNRSRKLALELLSHELKQLALLLLESYMNGQSPPANVLAKLGAAIKFKLFEFFIGVFIDILSSVLGKKLNIGESKMTRYGPTTENPIDWLLYNTMD